MLSRDADATLLVVAAGQTRQGYLHRAAEKLAQVNARQLPLVPVGHFTDPAVMPATRKRCSSRKPTTMGTLTVSDAAMTWFQ